MKYATLASLSLVVATLGIAACDSNKNAPQDRPPTVTDPTAAPTTGESVPGTGDRRAPSEAAGDAASDTAITTKVKTALLAEEDLKSTEISVETKTGTVTLTGTVPTSAQSDKAASVARNIEGVTNVDNRLTVKS